MKVLYLTSTGEGDPTRASLPLHVAANGSAEIGQECALVMIGDGTELARREVAERLEGVGVPPVRDLVQKLRANEVPVFV
jgi:predicted peroxiredoxin